MSTSYDQGQWQTSDRPATHGWWHTGHGLASLQGGGIPATYSAGGIWAIRIVAYWPLTDTGWPSGHRLATHLVASQPGSGIHSWCQISHDLGWWHAGHRLATQVAGVKPATSRADGIPAIYWLHTATGIYSAHGLATLRWWHTSHILSR